MTQETKAKGYRCFFAIFLVIVSVIGFSVSLSWSSESNYPNRPINMIVPFGPGGGADLGSRIIANKISEFLGQPIISIYKAGGGGTLGTAFASKAKPDGYTFLAGVGSGTLSLFPAIKKLDYNSDDFVLLGGYGQVPNWLVVRADAKWKSLKEFVEEEKKAPGSLKVGSYGKLTFGEFVLVLLNKYANIKATYIPYKSGAEALTAVLGGHIDAAVVTGAGGLLESGQIRILAISSERRMENLPDVPTFVELGYPIDLVARYCLAFPKGTPKEIVGKFTKAREEAFRMHAKEIQDSLSKVEIYAENSGPNELAEKYKKDFTVVYRLAEELGLIEK